MRRKEIIITTSWDDGFEKDLRLAELLEKYNIKGTFYVPISNCEREVMTASALAEISKIHEIGGHTVNHKFLNTLGAEAAKYEVSACKNMLQDKLGKTVDAFCFPGGKYSARDIKLVKDAGFLFGRTTKFFHTEHEPMCNIMHTSMQVFNHSNVILIRHCLKNLFLTPIAEYGLLHKGHLNFPDLADRMLLNLLDNGGVLHLWGHSWEIDKFNLWTELEDVLKILSNHEEISYLNNTECWNVLNKEL